jgi:membrane protease YdiL (CAAX protease family)
MNNNNDVPARLWSLFVSGSPKFVPQTRWRAFSASFVSVAIIVIAPLAALCAAKIYHWIAGLGVAQVFPPGEIDRLLMTQEAVYLFTLHATLLCLTIIAASRFGCRPARVLALAPPVDARRVYAASLLIALAVTAVWFSVVMTWMHHGIREDWLPYQEQMARPRSWLIVLIRVLLAPVAEELLFRGFLFPALLRTPLGFLGASLLTSLCWTVLHVDRPILALLQLFAAGLFSCWLLVRTGSLRVPIICHVLYNAGVTFVVIVLGWPALSH